MKKEKPISIVESLLFIVICVGLLAAVTLVQRQQQLNSSAQSSISNAFDVGGNEVFRVSDDPPTWSTKSLDISIFVPVPSSLVNP